MQTTVKPTNEQILPRLRHKRATIYAPWTKASFVSQTPERKSIGIWMFQLLPEYLSPMNPDRQWIMKESPFYLVLKNKQTNKPTTRRPGSTSKPCSHWSVQGVGCARRWASTIWEAPHSPRFLSSICPNAPAALGCPVMSDRYYQHGFDTFRSNRKASFPSILYHFSKCPTLNIRLPPFPQVLWG